MISFERLLFVFITVYTIAITQLYAADDEETCVYVFNPTDISQLQQLCMATSDDVTVSAIELSTLDAFSSVALSYDLNGLWLLIAGALVFLMQAGFAILEAGSVKAPNVQSMLFKCLMNTCIATIVWYLFGFCVAFGDPESSESNGFLGTKLLALSPTNHPDSFDDWIHFFFQWAFAANAVAIISGGVAERCSYVAYLTYAILVPLWVYPIVVHWFWDVHGWLSPFNDNPVVDGGVIDFAGSGVVHMVGGWMSLVGSWALSPRLGVFGYYPADVDYVDRGSARNAELARQSEVGNNVPMQMLGTLLLWLGWYGFNPGSTLFASHGGMELASKCAVTTTLAAASGGVAGAIIGRSLENVWSLQRVCNGILAGLVSITAGCAVIGSGSAIATGAIASCMYYAASKWLHRLHIDDPLDAWAVHGVAGVWGMISVALFTNSKQLSEAGYNSTLVDASVGYLFSTQLLGVVIIIGWTLAHGLAIFGVLKAVDWLRVDVKSELIGLDTAEHGGTYADYAGVIDNESEMIGGNSQRGELQMNIATHSAAGDNNETGGKEQEQEAGGAPPTRQVLEEDTKKTETTQLLQTDV